MRKKWPGFIGMGFILLIAILVLMFRTRMTSPSPIVRHAGLPAVSSHAIPAADRRTAQPAPPAASRTDSGE